MVTIKMSVEAGAEAARFNTAFYRYLTAHARSANRLAECWILKTAPQSGTETKIATFWSNQAASRFVDYWNGCRTA